MEKAKLGDFGIAKSIEEVSKTNLTAIGTVDYAAPEMTRGEKPYNFSNDIWALGLVAFKTAALKFPFNGKIWMLQTTRPLLGLPERYSRELVEFVDSLLQLEPDKRPTMGEVILSPFLIVRKENNCETQKEKAVDMSLDIFQASKAGKIVQLEDLLNRGVDVNAKNARDYNRTAIHYAASEGHKNVASLLIGKGGDPTCIDRNGWTPLHLSASGGHKDVADLLIQKGAGVNSSDNDGWTALQLASANGYKDLATLLIEKGAKVNVKDKFGMTAMRLATENGHTDLVDLLINKGAYRI